MSDTEVSRLGDVRRLSARLTWEDSEHVHKTVWFEWPASDDEELSLASSTLLLAAYPLAMWYGERRLHIEPAVCPRLADGTRAAMALLSSWHATLRPVALDVRERISLSSNSVPRHRAAFGLSGGVDALTALYVNRQAVPAGHAASLTDGLFAFGLNSYDFEDGEPGRDRLAMYEAQCGRLQALCARTDLVLQRVATNLRALYPSFAAYGAVAHGSPLAALGHGVPGVRSFALANAGAGIEAGITPHPLLDALYASHDVEVYASQIMLPRLEKIRLLSTWPDALAALRVCFLIEIPPDGLTNCGRCEKCVRTMLEFLAVGALNHAPFPTREFTPGDIAMVSFDSLAARIFFREVAPALAARGRDDLAAAIRTALAQWETGRSAPKPWWRRLGM